jgi:hypothetical protein
MGAQRSSLRVIHSGDAARAPGTQTPGHRAALNQTQISCESTSHPAISDSKGCDGAHPGCYARCAQAWAS